MIFRSIILFLIVHAVLAMPAVAKVVITEKKEWFRVGGLEPDVVLASIKAQRGGNVVALTKSNYRLEYAIVGQGTKCRIENLVLTAEITYVLPRWSNYDRARPELRTAWNRFSKAVWKHEDGHGKHARAAAHEMEQAISGLRGHCASLKIRAGAKMDLVQSRYQLVNQRYDAETHHGQKQGIVFP